ncbi:hypothetical protein [Nocardiopsis sp. CNT312]|nr:hypothetical protein [Nocardiopsis sp. CNT312]
MSKKELVRLWERFLELERVAQKLSGRPRTTLGWRTPAERLRSLV